jgi:hypothetical protein
MTYAAQLLEIVKSAKGLDTDAALARLIGVSKPALSDWKHSRGSPMPQERVLQLCEIGHIAEADRGYWLTGIQRDAVTVTGVMRALDAVLDRLRPVVATAGMLTVVMLGGYALSSGAETSQGIHYAKWLRRMMTGIRGLWRAEEHCHDTPIPV